MASLGHVAVGMALGRRYARHRPAQQRWAYVGLSALALLPDADVVAFWLGIPYAAPWGHRGASHSLAFAALLALGLGLAVHTAGGRGLRVGVFAFLALGSHGLLDALTDGGLGAALLWPFSDARYFSPLRPLPVAPIAGGMLSARGLYVLAVEALLFLPAFAYALWPRRAALRGRAA
jgi:inner membrane protein